MNQLLSCETNCTLVGNDCTPNIALQEKNRPIEKRGRRHREYLKRNPPVKPGVLHMRA